MPAPRKRAAQPSDDDQPVASEGTGPAADPVGDLSHRAEQYERGYIGEKPDPKDD